MIHAWLDLIVLGALAMVPRWRVRSSEDGH